MTQLDPRSSPTITPSPPAAGGQPGKHEPFNWRVSVVLAIGPVLLFGVLFGLRALGIFPPRPGEDPEIAAVRATLAALPTQQAAPAAKPTLAPTRASAAAPAQPLLASTPAPTTAAPPAATPPIPQTSAPALAPTQLPATKPATDGAKFETAPTPAASQQGVPTVGATAAGSAPSEATPDTSGSGPAAQATPVAINLPADLANAILQGYTNYWTVRVNAMRDPTDTTIDLGSVMAGSELVGAQQTIDQYRDARQAFESDVKHTIWITSASADKAVIVDQFTATTLRVDPDTKAPLDTTPSVENRTDTFELQHLDGTWKVVDEP